MTVGPVLPAGDDAFDGVESVRGHMFSCQKLDGRLMSVIAARDICNRCNPNENPSSYKNCQHAALGVLGALGRLAGHGGSDSARVAAFDAIGMVLFGVEEEKAALIFQNSEVLDSIVQAIDRSLNTEMVVSQPERQSALYCLLQLSHLECLHGVLAPLLSRVRDLLLDPLSLHAVKADSLSVLSSFAARPSSPIAATMDEYTLQEATVQLAANDPEHCLSLGLLLADLKDYGLLDQGDRFAAALHSLRHEHGFMDHFKAALAASVKGQQWPEGSNCYPSMERMTWCAAHLTELGALKELEDIASLLIEASLLSQGAEKPAIMALRQLAELPAAFRAIESCKEFMQMLHNQEEMEEAIQLLEYMKRMQRTMIVWCSDLSPMSQAAMLMAAQSHLSKAVEWREATREIPQESSLHTLCRLESWQFGTYGYMPLLGRAAWLWSEESPDMRLALCFGAFKRLLTERRQQRTEFTEELQMLNSEALTLRQGSVVQRGPEALMSLALKWNRRDLSGISEGCGSPGEMKVAEEVLSYMEWFEELHKVLLHGLVLPQLLPPAEVEETDVYMEVHKARCEAEVMLLQLENDLSKKMKTKRLCGDRLTLADLYGASVLRVAEIIGQEWFRYPSVSQYLDSIDLLPGCAETFQKLKTVIDEARQHIRASGTAMILV
eukprot:gnl/MRDRNA2_/MRDRNA2_43675_c0_seq1.p1 gnl/MRDRNA2_/MRDRNA2_43675_c0~~gnl/MRDRNA2_/MRDRNA2_43675_c0_seq1.p1  ORF type:complete len:697 (+),score=151.56 gnl/MRDRNA2_/MRDRNA2_43675_c0_seq1:97-2091(+)